MTVQYDNRHFFEPLRQILSRVLTQGPLRDKAKMVELWSVWEDAVGPAVAAHARPLRIEKGLITVLVDTPVWHHQLQMLQGKVIAELNARLHGKPVRELRFKVGG